MVAINLKSAFIASSNVVFGTLRMELGNDKLMKTTQRSLDLIKIYQLMDLL